MQTIINVKTHGQFTQEQLDLADSLIARESYPQYYTNEVFDSLVVEGLMLIDADLIARSSIGNTQSVRYHGISDEYDTLKSDIIENGWRLYEKPILVKRIPGTGKFKLLDGVTKDKILFEMKFKNRICMVVDCHEDEEKLIGQRWNSGEDKSPAGLIKEADIINLLQELIRDNKIVLDYKDIKNTIDKICGKGKFSDKKRTDLAYLILHQETAIQNSSLRPIVFSSGKEVESWLVANKYIETPTVVYIPYAASSPIKAYFAAAKLSQQKPGKEVRLVVYVSKLSGYNMQKCYINAISKFKTSWFDNLDLISNTYYNGAKYKDDKVVLYGCIPANIEDICEEKDKMIIFGKNDQKINDSYFTNKSMSTLFDLEEEEDE